MLGYLEQMNQYNAANFSWTVTMGPGGWINSTVSYSIVSTFICPSDGISPNPPGNDHWYGELNNYMASMGTTTAYGGPNTATTGVFTQAGKCYGVQQVTDGTSNTIAYGEALVGDESIQNVKWRDGPIVKGKAAANVPDVSTVPLATLMIDLEACEKGMEAPVPPGSNLVNQKGCRWASNMGGYSLINTIVPP